MIFKTNKKPSWNQREGKKGERMAKHFLSRLSYRLISQGYRSRYGEIDLIAVRGQTLCFIEVKYRNHLGYGHPFEAIHPKKLQRLSKAAQDFLAQHPEYSQHYFFEFMAIGIEKKAQSFLIESVKILF